MNIGSSNLLCQQAFEMDDSQVPASDSNFVDTTSMRGRSFANAPSRLVSQYISYCRFQISHGLSLGLGRFDRYQDLGRSAGSELVHGLFRSIVHPEPHPWILVMYEKLVRHGEEEIQRIFNALEFEIPPNAVKGLRMPSRSVREHSSILTGEDPLAGWTKYLSKEQVKRILHLVSAFGLDFYSQEWKADYERIEGQPVMRHA